MAAVMHYRSSLQGGPLLEEMEMTSGTLRRSSMKGFTPMSSTLEANGLSYISELFVGLCRKQTLRRGFGERNHGTLVV